MSRPIFLAPRLLAMPMLALSAAVCAEPQPFDLPAQPLADSIRQIADLSGVSIAVEGSLVAGRTAPAVKGDLEPVDALKQVLAASGLLASVDGSRVIITRDATQLHQVEVEAETLKEGSAEAGYRPTTAKSTGPWGGKPILDTPYSINVVSSDLIENMVISREEDLFKITPTAQLSFSSGVNRGGTTTATLRGFQFGTTMEDGLRTTSTQFALEDKERAEILTGVSGFLYGPAVVGGITNYVYKRPTAEPIARVSAGTYSNLQGFAHVDVGGPIDAENRFSYRLNVVASDGETALEGQELEKHLATLALDWNIAQGTTLSVIGSYQDRTLQGFESYWVQYTDPATGGNYFHYDWVPDPKLRYTQDYTRWHDKTYRASASINSKLSDVFSIRAAYSYARRERGSYFNNNNYLSEGADEGIYETSIWQNGPQAYPTYGRYAFLDASFNTGFVEHKATLGYYGSKASYKRQLGYGSITRSVENLNVFDGPPGFIPPAELTGLLPSGDQWFSQTITQFNSFVAGDEISVGSHIVALVGVNYAKLDVDSFNFSAPFARTSAYKKSKATPSLSLIYKPVEAVSTYFTYSQSLEQGAVVPASGSIIYTNAGKVLPPFTSSQYEFGAKANIGGLLLTGALFKIDKALQYAVTNGDGTSTYVQDGRQVHKGVELTATGNVWEGFRIYGGVSFIDPKVKKQEANPALIDKQPTNVAKWMAKISAEHDLPFLPGFTLTGGVYHVGEQAADTLNIVFFPGYTTGDVGFRYTKALVHGPEFSFRLNLANVTNEAYWVNNVGVGAPRTLAFSAQAKF